MFNFQDQETIPWSWHVSIVDERLFLYSFNFFINFLSTDFYHTIIITSSIPKWLSTLLIQNPLSTEELVQKHQRMRERSFSRGVVARAYLPRTTKAKLVFYNPHDHCRAKISQTDPKALLAVKVHMRWCTRQEQCPGARASAVPKRSPAWPMELPTC